MRALANPPQVYEAVEKEYPEDLECLTYLQVSFVCLYLSVSVWVGGCDTGKFQTPPPRSASAPTSA